MPRKKTTVKAKPRKSKGESLVIVESPAKTKTLSKILGKGYKIESCYGHVRDLPPKKMGLSIKKDFKPKYEIIQRQIKVVKHLKLAAKRAKEVYLASDPDREGEAIAWHLSEALDIKPAKIRRVSFNELTEQAVLTAFKNPSQISMDKVNAQQARRFLDRIVGYKLSPLLWVKIARGLSAGRVQSVAVKLVVQREKEIKAFIPQEYWDITAQLNQPSQKQISFSAELKQLDKSKVGNEIDSKAGKIRIPDEAEAKSLVEQLKAAQWRVAEITRKERKDQPPPPFTTSLLQQQASVRLRFSPKKTMMFAQQLYEGVDLPEGSTALITYMRTDSFRVSEDAIKACREFVTHKYGEKFLNEEVRRYRSKKSAQEAHEAIRPTYVNLVPDEIKQHLTPDQYKLYRLIWSRFVATQMKPPEWLITTARVEATPDNPIQIKIAGVDKGDKTSFTAQHAFFTTTARKLVFSGYLELTIANPVNEASSEENGEETSEEIAQKDAGEILAVLKENDSLNLEQLIPAQHFTKAPPRYSEASLIKMLEKYDIGRPSTYAPIISTIQGRGYVRRLNRYLFATDLGILVTDKLQEFFEDIMNTDFTAQMEEKLDLVEEAKSDWIDLLKEFYKVFEKDLEKAKFGMTKEKGMESEGGEKCDKCNAPMVIRWSKRGKFLACSKYPDCKTTQSITSPLDSDMEKALEQINEPCPKCGKRMVIKFGPRGRFLACPGYPECKSTKPIRDFLPKLDE